MKIGKLPNEILAEIIKDLVYERREIITGPKIGKDTAILDFREKLCVISTDPITGTSKDIGNIAMNIATNDLSTEGAMPVACMITILIPPEMELDEFKSVMEDIKVQSEKLNIAIVGGHTEVTDAVNRIVISTTVLGSIDRPYREKEVQTNDLIVVTKTLGIEGTYILAKEYEEKVRNKLSDSEYAEAISYGEKISVLEEGIIAKKHGAKYMHDITEGGVLGALWETSAATKRGLVAFGYKFPISKITEKICLNLGVNPLKLISSGSLLMVISENDYEMLKEIYETKNIVSTVVGKITDFNGPYLNDGQKLKLIPQPKSDELYRAKEEA